MNDQQRAAMQMALEALEDWKAWDDAVNQYPVWTDKDKVAITALREALENNELSDVTLINEGDMAQPQVAPDGRVAKTVFTFEDMQKAAEMGYESGKAEAEALAHPQGKECKYNSGICNRRGCRGICQATELGKKYRELEAQSQDHSEQHLNMVQGEPVAWALKHKNGLEFNTGYGMVKTLQEAEDMQRRHLGDLKIVPLYTTPPYVEAFHPFNENCECAACLNHFTFKEYAVAKAIYATKEKAAKKVEWYIGMNQEWFELTPQELAAAIRSMK